MSNLLVEDDVPPIVARVHGPVVGRVVDPVSTLGLMPAPPCGASVRDVKANGLGSMAVWRGIPPTDLVVPALFGAGGTIELVVQGYEPVAVGLATYWFAIVALCARRRYPLAMPLVVAGIYALTPVVGFDVSEPAAWVPPPALACFAAGLHVPRARAALGLASVVGCLAIIFASLDWLTEFDPDVVFGLLFSLGPWVLGLTL